MEMELILNAFLFAKGIIVFLQNPHSMKKTSAKFQKHRNKTVSGVALTRYPG